jgi:hypothetical protein
MLRIQNRDVDWAQHQIVIRGINAKDAENRRIPFDPHGRLAPILKRRATLGPYAFVFGSPDGEFQDSFKTAWESLQLVAYGHETKRAKPGVREGTDRRLGAPPAVEGRRRTCHADEVEASHLNTHVWAPVLLG